MCVFLRWQLGLVYTPEAWHYPHHFWLTLVLRRRERDGTRASQKTLRKGAPRQANCVVGEYPSRNSRPIYMIPTLVQTVTVYCELLNVFFKRFSIESQLIGSILLSFLEMLTVLTFKESIRCLRDIIEDSRWAWFSDSVDWDLTKRWKIKGFALGKTTDSPTLGLYFLTCSRENLS